MEAAIGTYVGSLAGRLDAGAIRNCYAIGVTVSGKNTVGGLAGRIDEDRRYDPQGKVTGCYCTGKVTGVLNVGGLAGAAFDVRNCYAMGIVLGDDYVGGLVGQGEIVSCYAVGLVVGNSNSGGLVGRGSGEESFWEFQTGNRETYDIARSRAAAQMRTVATYLAWGTPDNEGIWTIDEGRDYPRLAWEGQPGITIGPLELSHLLPGTGTPSDPYRIYTAGQLDLIGRYPEEWDKHYELMADLDLGDYTGTHFHRIAAGYGEWGHEITPIPFTGVFDGKGHSIHNFTWELSPKFYWDLRNKDFVGLFGNIFGAEVKNLNLVNATIRVDDGHGIGALVGWNEGRVANCHVSGTITGESSVGGLVGKNDGFLVNCGSSGLVVGRDSVGGLAGSGSITTSRSTSDVVGNTNVGGLTGWLWHEATVRDCYASGRVIGYERVGGLIGDNRGGTIRRCYSTGDVIGATYAHGLAGDSSGRIFASFVQTEAIGKSKRNDAPALTMAEMMTAALFLEAGWDFAGEEENGTEDIWWIDEGWDYPRLWWEAFDEEE